MAGFKDLFIPRDIAFFEYLKTQVNLTDQATKILNLLKKSYSSKQLQIKHAVLDKLIKKGDSLMLLITRELHQTFITPIDRDEIQTLSFNLNRILHSIETIIAVVQIYHISNTDTPLKTQINLLQQSVKLLVAIFQHPLSTKDNQQIIAQIKTVENKADRVYRKALGNLFIKSKNLVEIMKKKELLQTIEDTIDKTEFVANVMQNVLINHA